MSKSDVGFYQQNHDMFMADFWTMGNSDFNLAIEPRDNVQSGRWYVVTWRTRKGESRRVEAQWHKLVWERVIKQYLADEASAAPPGEARE